MHIRNSAERAIKTFKKHFKAGLATTDESLPIHLWRRLLPQECTTINIIITSRMKPNMSSEAQINGSFDYNCTLLSLPGTKAVIHEKTEARGTWYLQGTKGWYIGGAQKHYQCWTIYVTKTSSERVSDTVEFSPQQCQLPSLSSKSLATKETTELTYALKNLLPALPFPSAEI